MITDENIQMTMGDTISTTGEPATDPAGIPEGAAEAGEDPKPEKGATWRVTLSQVLNKIDRGDYIPIPCNIPFIDNLTGGGFVPGTVTVITADPGAGKTALCQQMAAQFARNGHNVSFINYEMDEGLLLARDLSREIKPYNSSMVYDPAATPYYILRGDFSLSQRVKISAEAKKRFSDAVKDYEEHIYPRLYYRQFVRDRLPTGDYSGDVRPIRNTLDDLRELAAFNMERYKAEKAAAGPEAADRVKAPILFVDYIQLIAGTSDNKISTLEEITGILTDYARQGKTLVFAISSANRISRNARRKNGGSPPKAAGTGKPLLLYIDKSRLSEAKKGVDVTFYGSASKFLPTGKGYARALTEKEARNVLRMSSASGASVLEYSATYFISINEAMTEDDDDTEDYNEEEEFITACDGIETPADVMAKFMQ